ncbi:hypothetical protein [Wohlfahrtiimonas larvae]|uniref:Lipoprotein n=1 Tax=Wohlfahrtiimonas larvae TaxID=1157986 RepID=A0ABP9MNU8_9GAMM|nr:hypothetical protein [Wohlfahrtiimonas larvae]
MLKYLSLTSLIILIAGCSSTIEHIITPTEDSKNSKLSWEMEGRAPEWHISINDQRFHGSFPGRYEGRVMTWEETIKANKIYLKANSQTAKIELTEEYCTVAGKDYTHSATVDINQQTFKGCAKRKS